MIAGAAFFTSFNCYLDQAEKAYVMQHGGDTVRSAEFGNGRKLQLSLIASPAAPTLDPFRVKSSATSVTGGSLSTIWELDPRSSPCWSAELTIVDANGATVRAAISGNPELRALSSGPLLDGIYRVQTKLADIFSQSLTIEEQTLLIKGGATAVAITTQPAAAEVSEGSAATLGVVAKSSSPLVYQWYRDGLALTGATTSTFTMNRAQSSDAGNYTVSVGSSSGTLTSTPARLTVLPLSALSNLSVRTPLAANQTLIVGTVVKGGTKTVLVRAAGPALSQFGLQGMPDPRLELYTGGQMPTATNDDWSASLAPTFTAVGAFPWDRGTKDAALSQAAAGAFTVQAKGGSAGVVLVELYDVSGGVSQRLVNVSARNRVGSGDDVLIAGFTVRGSGTKELLIRGVGPALTPLGVTGALADPNLRLYDSSNVVIAANDNWDASLGTVFDAVGAFGFASGSKDAALKVAVRAGASYTIVVSGQGASVGEALVEVYELP